MGENVCPGKLNAWAYFGALCNNLMKELVNDGFGVKVKN